MNKDNTTSGSNIDDNLLNITDQDMINIAEAEGVAKAEKSLLYYEIDTVIDTFLILKIHDTAFGHLYEWAGKLRQVNVIVGNFEPPHYNLLPNLMAEFSNQLQFLLKNVKVEDDLIYSLAFAHHKIVQIHPFKNGNGRVARLLSNLIAYLNGYQAIQIYHSEGDARKKYIDAIKKADIYEYQPLMNIIKKQLNQL